MIPLFSTSASLQQGGIFTVEKAGDKEKNGRKTGPVSLCDLAKEEKLKELYMVETNFVNFMSAQKNLEAVGTQLKFGLKLVICEDMGDKSEESLKTESNVILFMGSDDAYKALIKIYSRAAVDGFYYVPRLDWKDLRTMWSDDLILALPFYSSFLAKNALTFAAISPDLPTKPIALIERQLLPFDGLLTSAVKKYAAAESLEVQPTKSVYYRNRSDANAWMIWQCILRRTTWDKPNIEWCVSKEFSWESYKGSIS